MLDSSSIGMPVNLVLISIFLDTLTELCYPDWSRHEKEMST
jgi:hypothetical protein